MVETWKGVTKYVGLAFMGLAAAGSLLHGVLGRPNRVTDEDEEHAEQLVEGATGDKPEHHV